MSETTHPRARLSASPAEIIRALPAMGRIMINTRWNGATHERMGAVEAIGEDKGWLVCSGPEHTARIELSRIASVVVDRTSIMGGEAYPRADFRLADGSVLCSAISFSGLAPFDAALAAFGPGEALPVEERTPPAAAAAASEETDPGAIAFERALAAGAEVTIRVERPGFIQHWQGVVEKVSPSRGFINVMRPDFHLHLRAGAVSGWQESEEGGDLVLSALGPDGAATGLTLRGRADALAAGTGLESAGA